MEERPKLNSLCCINPECNEYKLKGRKNLTVRKTYGEDKIRYLKCRVCGEEFSERKGSALFNTKVSEEKAVSVLKHLSWGNRIVATASLLSVSKDTVSRLIRVTGRVSQGLHDQMVQEVEVKAIQFDEKWSFTKKTEEY
ncbi:MAG: hypothetical protein COB67_08765 [SAR324 cluster bacterium]|uniref:IS1 family transposase n=1 Tax=SAR324 cluster bacterium TaxID=2024889 RepID=A0A2A4T0Z8_9DELT|nr:MAG: hypothetical protein COB67_08765 [SAR324 cluster bacterium]